MTKELPSIPNNEPNQVLRTFGDVKLTAMTLPLHRITEEERSEIEQREMLRNAANETEFWNIYNMKKP
jgi:hypothetical protein